jgi:hypothetical protein
MEVCSLEPCLPAEGTLSMSLAHGKFSLGFRILIKWNKYVVKLTEQI